MKQVAEVVEWKQAKPASFKRPFAELVEAGLVTVPRERRGILAPVVAACRRGHFRPRGTQATG